MKKKGAVDLVALGIFIALTVLIPATVKLVQQNQENRSLARLAEEEDAYIEEQTQKQEEQQMYDNSPSPSERRAVTNPEDFNNTAAGQVKECPCGGQWPNCKNCEPDAPPPPPQTHNAIRMPDKLVCVRTAVRESWIVTVIVEVANRQQQFLQPVKHVQKQSLPVV